MSHLFFSADLHLGHGNICIYCNRPYLKPEYVDDNGKFINSETSIRCAKEMSSGLIDKWNSRVARNDTVIHVGDFCTKGRARDVDGLRDNSVLWESRLNGKIIFIRGNHDKNNGLKFGLDTASMVLGGMMCFIIHNPAKIPADTVADFIVCGHVHDRWNKEKGIHVYRRQDRMLIPVINVGVDARKYMPIRADELIGLVKKWYHESGQEIT